MGRRLAGGASGAISLLVAAVLVAGCGGEGASASPSVAPAATPAPTQAVVSPPPSAEPEPSATTAPERLLAACEGVAIRTEPATTAELVTRVAKLTKVRVVERVQGEAYEVGACGESGSEWVKIDRINGTAVRRLYGTRYGYAAAGFFE
jgi:hypothetical protein